MVAEAPAQRPVRALIGSSASDLSQRSRMGQPLATSLALVEQRGLVTGEDLVQPRPELRAHWVVVGMNRARAEVGGVDQRPQIRTIGQGYDFHPAIVPGPARSS